MNCPSAELRSGKASRNRSGFSDWNRWSRRLWSYNARRSSATCSKNERSMRYGSRCTDPHHPPSPPSPRSYGCKSRVFRAPRTPVFECFGGTGHGVKGELPRTLDAGLLGSRRRGTLRVNVSFDVLDSPQVLPSWGPGVFQVVQRDNPHPLPAPYNPDEATHPGEGRTRGGVERVHEVLLHVGDHVLVRVLCVVQEHNVEGPPPPHPHSRPDPGGGRVPGVGVGP